MQKEQLKKWVNDFTDELYQWAFYKTSSAITAEDLIQETFLAAAEKLQSFKGNSAPKTWLFSILNHKIIDYYRKKNSQPILINDNLFSNFFEEDGDWKKGKRPQNWFEEEQQLLDDEDFQKVLQECMSALPEIWNHCLQLKYLSEKKGAEICQELDLSTTNFWQIVHRAKLQVRNCVEGNWYQNN